MKAGGIEKYEDPEFLESGFNSIKNLLKSKAPEDDPLSKTKKKRVKWVKELEDQLAAQAEIIHKF